MSSFEAPSHESSPEVSLITRAQREIRRVPLTYVHPLREDGSYARLFGPGQGMYEPEEIDELIREGIIETPEDMRSWYMPDFSDVPASEMGICVYETCSEGTPISPVFPDTPEGKLDLLRYITEHGSTFADLKTGIEGWAMILFGSTDILAMVDLQTGSLSTRIHPAHRQV